MVSEDCNKALECIYQVSGCLGLKDLVEFLNLICVHFYNKLIKFLFEFVNTFVSLNLILKLLNFVCDFVNTLLEFCSFFRIADMTFVENITLRLKTAYCTFK